jgi:uncharacterized protein YozE (UPF0346 family)
MTKPTFYQWLKVFRREDNPVGDLARDVLEDPTFPKRATSREDILEYLKSGDRDKNPMKGAACRGALDAFDKAWEMYGRDVR